MLQDESATTADYEGEANPIPSKPLVFLAHLLCPRAQENTFACTNLGLFQRKARWGEMGTSFKELVVWQRAIELSLSIYKLTAAFPTAEQFGLTSQLRRASVSVASNIAEGYGKSTKGEYLLFLGHARGSIFEVQTQLVIAEGLGLGSKQLQHTSQNLSEEVSKMLVAMMTRLKK